MGTIWGFLRKPANQRLLSWLGGGGVVAAGGIWAVVTYVWPAHDAPGTVCAQQGIVLTGRISGATITNNVSGGSATAGPCVETGKK